MGYFGVPDLMISRVRPPKMVRFEVPKLEVMRSMRPIKDYIDLGFASTALWRV